MRAVAISVWLFINLVFLGMCGYMYLLWRQYWLHAERQRLRLSVPTAPAYPYDVQYLDLVVQHGGGAKGGADKESRSSRRHLANHSSPQVKPMGSKCRPSVERCEGEEDPLQSRRLTPSVVAHKSQLVVQMRRVLLDEASFFAHDRNVYDVHYKGLKGSYNKIPPKDLVCALKKYVRIRTLTPSDEPFASLGIGQEFPSKTLYAKQSTKRHQFASCAIVASAGSLSDSRLGNFIDSHEAVVRFNHAPTFGFEADVGKKTTLRIVNSQVVSKPEFDFATSPLYQNISLLAWDPCNYTSTLMKNGSENLQNEPSNTESTSSDADFVENFVTTPRGRPRQRKKRCSSHDLSPSSLVRYTSGRSSEKIRCSTPVSTRSPLEIMSPNISSIHMDNISPRRSPRLLRSPLTRIEVSPYNLRRSPRFSNNMSQKSPLSSTVINNNISDQYWSPKQNNINSSGTNIFHMQNDHDYTFTPRSFKRKFNERGETCERLKKKVKLLKQSVTRLDQKIVSLKEILKTLGEEGLVSNSVKEMMQRVFDGAPLDLFNRAFDNKESGKIKRIQYPPALRSFALTLHYHSTGAYEFVRKKFNMALPDTSTLRSWYKEIDAEPGICEESISALKQKVDENKKNNLPPPVVCFIFDEASLKKGINHNHGKSTGLVDLGDVSTPKGEKTIAKEVLVCMVVSLDSSWKLPLSYYFTCGLSAEKKAGLVSDALCKLHEIGIQVEALTCDGPVTNISLCEKLGANLDLNNPICHFPHPHPECNKNIDVLLDACHMMKLTRNSWADFKTILNSKGEEINWKYIDKLYEIQEEKLKLRLGNKITKRHIEFRKQIMKVNLSVQTLSDSVADALEFLKDDLKLAEFSDCGPTIEFIRIMNRTFDHLNTRSPIAKGTKAPLSYKNEASWKPFFDTTLTYIKGLTTIPIPKGPKKKKVLTKVPLHKTKKRTAFLGLFVCLSSVRALFNRLCTGSQPRLKYLLTYKLSQDHIELFFCAVRARGGWNNNPTCAGFKSAFKRLLIRNEIKGGNGNVSAQDNTSILFVTSKNKKSSKNSKYKKNDIFDIDPIDKNNLLQNSENIIEIDALDMATARNYELTLMPVEKLNHKSEIYQYAFYLQNEPNLCLAAENVIAYMAGTAVDMIKKRIMCITCHSALTNYHSIYELKSSLDLETCRDQRLKLHMSRLLLTMRKNRGGLTFASYGLVEICIAAEKCIRVINNTNATLLFSPNIYLIISKTVLQQIGPNIDELFPDIRDHMFDNFGTNHLFRILREAVFAYCRIRIFDFAKRASLNLRGGGDRIQLSRLVIFNGL